MLSRTDKLEDIQIWNINCNQLDVQYLTDVLYFQILT